MHDSIEAQPYLLAFKSLFPDTLARNVAFNLMIEWQLPILGQLMHQSDGYTLRRPRRPFHQTKEVLILYLYERHEYQVMRNLAMSCL